MRAIASADGAVLVHCAGGRDRTGMICAMLLDMAGATADAIAADYADGWRGAGAYPGHGWVYDPGQRAWRQRHFPSAGPGELRRQLVEREPALRAWIRDFDTAGYLASNGLTDRDLCTLRSLLRPLLRNAAPEHEHGPRPASPAGLQPTTGRAYRPVRHWLAAGTR